MERRYRTKEETIGYFRIIASSYKKDADINNNEVAKGQVEAWEMAAFELERITKTKKRNS